MRSAFLLAAAVISAGTAHIQTARSATPYWLEWYGDLKDLSDLLSEGYEIKTGFELRSVTSSPELLYVQKGPSAYRCIAFDTGRAVQPPFNDLKCTPLQKPKLIEQGR